MNHDFVEMTGRPPIGTGGFLVSMRCVRCDRIGKMVVEAKDAAIGLRERVSMDKAIGRCRPRPHLDIRADGPHRLSLTSGPDLTWIGDPVRADYAVAPLALKCERCQKGVAYHFMAPPGTEPRRGGLLTHIERAVDAFNEQVPECRMEAQ